MITHKGTHVLSLFIAHEQPETTKNNLSRPMMIINTVICYLTHNDVFTPCHFQSDMLRLFLYQRL